uniref:Uncharacterized protein n=1 Tax=Arundo donax TaxID=35708 RepID=A0A0A8YRP6_ARUDO
MPPYQAEHTARSFLELSNLLCFLLELVLESNNFNSNVVALIFSI